MIWMALGGLKYHQGKNMAQSSDNVAVSRDYSRIFSKDFWSKLLFCLLWLMNLYNRLLTSGKIMYNSQITSECTVYAAIKVIMRSGRPWYPHSLLLYLGIRSFTNMLSSQCSPKCNKSPSHGTLEIIKQWHHLQTRSQSKSQSRDPQHPPAFRLSRAHMSPRAHLPRWTP